MSDHSRTSKITRRQLWPGKPVRGRHAFRRAEKGSNTPSTVIYHRVAVTKGSASRLSTCLKVCRQYAQKRGFAILGEFSDLGSGMTLDRPGLSALRQLIAQHPVDAVIIYDFSGLTRSVGHALQLRDEFESRGVLLYSALREKEI